MNKDVSKFVENLKHWKEETAKLRSILLKTSLEENFKWRLPCYSHNDQNILIIQPFKACLGVMFFKGALLKDPKKVLVSNGPNSRAGKRFEFRNVSEVSKLESTIKAYVKEAIAIEESGKKVEIKRKPEPIPAELKKMFEKKPKLKKAFDTLTPGRQRAYLIFFSGAKQSVTRESRIKKNIPRILAGKGLTD